MRCSNCGADIPEGMLICPDCRTEVQIVPDYNPFDDMLAREVKGSVEDATRPINSADLRRYQNQEAETDHSTRVLSQGELERIRSGQMKNTARIRTDYDRSRTGRQNTDRIKQPADRARQNTGAVRREAEERRRQQAAKKKRAAKKRRQKILLVVLFLLAALGIVGIVFYQNSYNGVVNKAYRALQSRQYAAAEKSFYRAISKDKKKSDAYIGLAKISLEQGDLDSAENIYLTAIDSQPLNAELYEAAIDFYVDTEQLDKISELLEGCDDTVLEKVKSYVADMPVFSLQEGSYTEVQQVSLEADGDIYYTTDGKEPTTESTLYTEPILVNEGTTIIKAISVNKKGVPSLTASRTYTVEIPIEDAPAVTPSTGQYNTPTKISIRVPEGYTAYYTMDGTTPSAASTKYTGPIDMPEGQTIFSAVLISKSGKMTQITKRNYVLEK